MSDTSAVQEAISATIEDGEIIKFRFEVDGSERVVGVLDEGSGTSRIIVGKTGKKGPKLNSVRGENIMTYSISDEILKRGLIGRFLGKNGAVNKLKIETVGGDSLVALIPAESRKEVQNQLDTLLEETRKAKERQEDSSNNEQETETDETSDE